MGRYGRWALVTGASRGIGRAFVLRLAESGYDLVLVGLEPNELEEIGTVVRGSQDIKVRLLPGDLGEEEFLARVEKTVRELDIGLMVLAAGYGIMGYFIQHPVDSYLRMMKVNDEAPLRLTHALLERRYTQGARGGLVLISSANAHAHEGVPFSSVYSASKSFLQLVGQALAYEMKPLGLDVITVSAWPTDTSFQERAHTRRLFFVETPDAVAVKALRSLGRKASIITNPVSRVLISIHNAIPSPRIRASIRAFFFGRVLSRRERMVLPDRFQEARAMETSGAAGPPAG